MSVWHLLCMGIGIICRLDCCWEVQVEPSFKLQSVMMYKLYEFWITDLTEHGSHHLTGIIYLIIRYGLSQTTRKTFIYYLMVIKIKKK